MKCCNTCRWSAIKGSEVCAIAARDNKEPPCTLANGLAMYKADE